MAAYTGRGGGSSGGFGPPQGPSPRPGPSMDHVESYYTSGLGGGVAAPSQFVPSHDEFQFISTTEGPGSPTGTALEDSCFPAALDMIVNRTDR